MQHGRKWEPINYHEPIGDLQERVKGFERKLDYLLDGVAKVLEDGETMAIHLQHLGQLGRCWTMGCYGKTIDLRQKSGITRSEAELSNSS